MSDSINLADGLTASAKWKDVISKRKTAQEWIPCSERLPETSGCETCVYKYDLYMNGGRFICIKKGTPFTSKTITYTTVCDKWEGKE